ncbi:MAG: GNAT family N-acetyltransferase [Novosphingobium sp.]|uniref:GNAT family N-acetyltransferase n=1 Tax=Novosphingobium sp. TaxID=1874826 RepID=UPI0032BDC45C
MFIRSERLFLRPGWPEDWQELLARIDDEAVIKNLAKAPWPYTADDARYFASKEQDKRLPHFFVTLPTSSAPAQLIGCVGLAEVDGEVELGYWFARDHWGKGYASEASRAVIGLARTLGHQRLIAGHFVDNPASGRVLRKVGFKPTGQIRQRYSLARGHDVQSIEHAMELAAPSNCDGPMGRRVA